MHSAVWSWSLQNRIYWRRKAHVWTCMHGAEIHRNKENNNQSASQLVLPDTAATVKIKIQNHAQSGWEGGLDKTPGFPFSLIPFFFLFVSATCTTWEESYLASVCYLWWCPAWQRGECLPGEVFLVILELYWRVQITDQWKEEGWRWLHTLQLFTALDTLPPALMIFQVVQYLP